MNFVFVCARKERNAWWIKEIQMGMGAQERAAQNAIDRGMTVLKVRYNTIKGAYAGNKLPARLARRAEARSESLGFA